MERIWSEISINVHQLRILETLDLRKINNKQYQANNKQKTSQNHSQSSYHLQNNMSIIKSLSPTEQVRGGGAVLPARAGDLREQARARRPQRGQDQEQPRLLLSQTGDYLSYLYGARVEY